MIKTPVYYPQFTSEFQIVRPKPNNASTAHLVLCGGIGQAVVVHVDVELRQHLREGHAHTGVKLPNVLEIHCIRGVGVVAVRVCLQIQTLQIITYTHHPPTPISPTINGGYPPHRPTSPWGAVRIHKHFFLQISLTPNQHTQHFTAPPIPTHTPDSVSSSTNIPRGRYTQT